MYAYVLVGISHAGADPVAFVEQSADDPPSDEAGGAGNGDSASLRNGRHAAAARSTVAFRCGATNVRTDSSSRADASHCCAGVRARSAAVERNSNLFFLLSECNIILYINMSNVEYGHVHVSSRTRPPMRPPCKLWPLKIRIRALFDLSGYSCTSITTGIHLAKI